MNIFVLLKKPFFTYFFKLAVVTIKVNYGPDPYCQWSFSGLHEMSLVSQSIFHWAGVQNEDNDTDFLCKAL